MGVRSNHVLQGIVAGSYVIGARTPSGVYKPQWLARKWRSRKYNNAPMPHSIFFHEGYAIHGTTEIARLGKIASHGCVRLHPDNAAKLYQLVEKQMATTRVVVSDDVIGVPDETPKKKKPSLFVAENGATGKRSAKALEAMALARQQTAALQNPPVVEKVGSTEAAKARPDRKDKAEKSSRWRGGGFRW